MEPFPKLLRPVVSYLTEPVPADLIRAFRSYFCFHIFINSLKLHWIYTGPLTHVTQAALLIGAVLAFHKKYYRIGLLPALAYKLFFVIDQLPTSANHSFLETLVVLLLLVFPDEPAGEPGKGLVDGTSVHLIQLALLSVYFYSSFQKLLYGFWLNGEYLANSLTSNEDEGMVFTGRRIVQIVGELLGTKLEMPIEKALSWEVVPFSLPTWAVVFFVATSWLVLITEAAPPPLILNPRTKKLGLWMIIAMMLGIAIYTWEVEFMLASVGVLLLYFPSKPIRNYAIAAVVHLAWSLYVILADIRIVIL